MCSSSATQLLGHYTLPSPESQQQTLRPCGNWLFPQQETMEIRQRPSLCYILSCRSKVADTAVLTDGLPKGIGARGTEPTDCLGHMPALTRDCHIQSVSVTPTVCITPNPQMLTWQNCYLCEQGKRQI